MTHCIPARRVPNAAQQSPEHPRQDHVIFLPRHRGCEGRMRRRDFIVGLGGAAVYPPVAWAQRADQKEPPTIGFLALGTERATLPYIEVFRSALVALGYSDQNLRVLYRFADGKAELLPG